MKIKNMRVKTNNKGQRFVVPRTDCGAKNLIEYILDHENIVDFSSLSEDKKQEIIEKYNLKSNEIFENTEKVNNLINYVSNNNKCFNEDTNTLMIDAINCDNKYNAAKEFIDCEKEYHKHKIENVGSHKEKDANGNVIVVQNIPNEAFHIIQSFKGKDVPKEKIHEIGLEFARRLCGESFKSVVTTHVNTDNFHNHIAICAYACDGIYKFRDSWNLGLKIQKLSDELALENGLEIITEIANDKYETDENELENLFEKNALEKNTNFTDIGQYKSNTLTKKRLIADIILTAKESNSFEEYEKKMNEKGYTLVQQLKSIKYVKSPLGGLNPKSENSPLGGLLNKNANLSNIDKVSKSPLGGLKQKNTTYNKEYNQMRDTRLGKQFTRPALEHYFLEKQKNNLIENIKEEQKFKLNIYELKPKKFLGTKGNIVRVPLIFQILEFLLKLLDAILFGNKEYLKPIPNKNDVTEKTKKELRTQITKVINAINKVKELLEKYNLQNLNSLKIKKKQVLRLYVQHKNQIQNKLIALKKFKKIKDAITNFNETSEFIKEKNISDKDLLIMECGEANILENLASIDPMTPQTKSRLYKALHNSNFKLNYKFTQLTENQAKAICYYMAAINKGNHDVKMPDTLYTKQEYLRLKKSGKLHEPEYTPNINNLMQPDLSKYTDEEIKIIKKYKQSVLLLKSFGIKQDTDSINSFLDNINKTETLYRNLENIMFEEKAELQDLNLLEDFFKGKLSERFKPIGLLEDTNLIDNEIEKYINDNESIKEQLITLKTLLNDPDIVTTLETLDNENIIIPPAEVLAIYKTIKSCLGEDLENKDIFKTSKADIKKTIDEFREKYDIDKYLKSELNNEINIEKERLGEIIKNTLIEQKSDAEITKLNKIEKEKYEEELKDKKNNEEFVNQTEKDQEDAINKIIDAFTR